MLKDMFPDTLVVLTKRGDFTGNQYAIIDGGVEYMPTNLVLDTLKGIGRVCTYWELKAGYEERAKDLKAMWNSTRPVPRQSLAPIIFDLYEMGHVDLPEDPEKMAVVQELADRAERGVREIGECELEDILIDRGVIKIPIQEKEMKKWIGRLMNIRVIRAGPNGYTYAFNIARLNDYARYYTPSMDIRQDLGQPGEGDEENYAWELRTLKLSKLPEWVSGIPRNLDAVEYIDEAAKRISGHVKGLTDDDVKLLTAMLVNEHDACNVRPTDEIVYTLARMEAEGMNTGFELSDKAKAMLEERMEKLAGRNLVRTGSFGHTFLTYIGEFMAELFS